MSKFFLTFSIVWVVLALIIGVVMIVPQKSDKATTKVVSYERVVVNRPAENKTTSAVQRAEQLKTKVRLGQRNVMPVSVKIKS